MLRRKKTRRARVKELRLTPAGWLFAAICLLVGAAGVKSQAPLMLMLLGGLFAALVISGALAWRMVSRIQLRRELPGRIRQHQVVHLAYYLRNTRRLGSCLGVTVQEVAPEGLECAAGFCVHIPPQGLFRAGGRFSANRRGRIRLGGVRLGTILPFGLVRAMRAVSSAAELVVWPARGRMRGHPLRHGASEASRAAPSQAKGGQDEFFGLREYHPDDNPRWIAWRRSATRNTLVVREMSRPLPDVLWIIFDTFCDDLSGLGEAAREKMIRFAATLIDHAFARGYQVGLALATNGDVSVYKPAAGRGQRRQLLDALADVGANTRSPISTVLEQLHRGQFNRALVYVLTADEAGLKDAPLGSIASASRRLIVVDDGSLAAVFDDSGAAEGGDDACR